MRSIPKCFKCVQPYKVVFDKHGFYVVEFDKEQQYAGDISPLVFEEELNAAFDKGFRRGFELAAQADECDVVVLPMTGVH